MAICRLCQNERELRNSHIIPEFLYDDLYNDNNQIMGINGIGNRGWKPLQKGVREYLFCEDCEQHFNEYCEKPFKAQWIDASLLPKVLNLNDIHWLSLDYASFKLFHLSIFFRASVSSLPSFSAVSLGPHEEVVRKLILSRDPGPSTKYPIFAYAVVHHQTHAIVPIISQAEHSLFGGHRCYGMIYGGVHWWCSFSSHRNWEFERAGLQPDGRMPFSAVPWNEVSVVQSAANALRNTVLRQKR
jgi:hypothetical protein